MIDKKYILEAIHRGIQLALDDYDDEQESLARPQKDVIRNNNQIAGMLQLEELYKKISKFIDGANAEYYIDSFKKEHKPVHDVRLEVGITKEDLLNIEKYYKATGYRYTIHNTENLKQVVRMVLDADHPYANLNWIDVSQISNFWGIFKNTQFVGDISEWDVSNARVMNEMFNHTIFNGDISRWDVSNVTTMSHMFEESYFNKDISRWDVRKVKYVFWMFRDAQKFNQDLSNWELETVKKQIEDGEIKFVDAFVRSKIDDKFIPKIIKEYCIRKDEDKKKYEK